MSTKNHKPAATSAIVPGTPATNPSPSPLDPQHSNTSSPSTLNTRHSNNPFPSLATRARCGKVARLPKEIRDQLNEMLLDGVPHSQIIQELRHNFGTPCTAAGSADIPAGPQSNVVPLDSVNTSTPIDPTSDSPHAPVLRSLSSEALLAEEDHESANTDHASSSIQNPVSSIQNPASSIEHPASDPFPIKIQNSKIENLDLLTPQHITTWKKFGGYRDWLKDQQRIEECQLRHELTVELARSAEGLASYQAAPKVAVAQICQTIIDLGPEGLKEAMQASPLNCFRLLNALARLINSGLKCEQQIQKAAVETSNQLRDPVTSKDVQRVEMELNLL